MVLLDRDLASTALLWWLVRWEIAMSESLSSILTSQPRPQAGWLAAGWLTGGESCGAGGLMPGVSSGASVATST